MRAETNVQVFLEIVERLLSQKLPKKNRYVQKKTRISQVIRKQF